MKRSKFTIEWSGTRTTFEATPRDAAKKAARLAARGTLNRGGSIYDQPTNMMPPAPSKLIDEAGSTVMTCRPSVTSVGAARRGARVRYSFAKCTIKPGFKSQIAPRKRKKRR